MTLDEIIRGRRSIRKYTPQPVPPEMLNSVLEAGRLAPSARNEQSWHFTVVQSAAARARLEKLCCDQPMVSQAPLTLIVWADAERTMTCGHSAAVANCSIALSFMMLKAAELGLGTCWLGAFNAEAVRSQLGLPQGAVVVAVSPLGWPNEAPAPRGRKPLAQVADIRESDE